jgi:hypothetical protein
MQFTDKRLEALSNICMNTSRVNFEAPIVFLFGGQLAPKNKKAKSVRAKLLKHLTKTKSSLKPFIVKAEDFKDWIEDSKYGDLLSFETDLAQLSSLIILILESPGSIGELGAFCINTQLKNKLIVILSEDHLKEKSFISLGLLRQIKRDNIYYYPWSPANISNTVSDELEYMTSDIQDHLETIDKTEKFNDCNNGHIALLIYELTRVFKALILKEINEYLKLLNIEINPKKTKQLLYMLEKIGLIKERCRGSTSKQMYYLAVGDKQRFRFSIKDKKKPLDIAKTTMDTMLYYSQNDIRRLRLIQDSEQKEGSI